MKGHYPKRLLSRDALKRRHSAIMSPEATQFSNARPEGDSASPNSTRPNQSTPRERRLSSETDAALKDNSGPLENPIHPSKPTKRVIR